MTELRKRRNAFACMPICIAHIDDSKCDTHKICEAHDDIQEQHLLDWQVLVADEPAVGDWNEAPAAHYREQGSSNGPPLFLLKTAGEGHANSRDPCRRVVVNEHVCRGSLMHSVLLGLQWALSNTVGKADSPGFSQEKQRHSAKLLPVWHCQEPLRVDEEVLKSLWFAGAEKFLSDILPRLIHMTLSPASCSRMTAEHSTTSVPGPGGTCGMRPNGAHLDGWISRTMRLRCHERIAACTRGLMIRARRLCHN